MQVEAVDWYLDQLDAIRGNDLTPRGFNIGDVRVPTEFEVHKSLDSSLR